MWQPQPFLNRQLAQLDELGDIFLVSLAIHFLAMTERLKGWLDLLLNELMDPGPNLFVFWRQCEINHFVPLKQ